jgi:hypothetical protein
MHGDKTEGYYVCCEPVGYIWHMDYEYTNVFFFAYQEMTTIRLRGLTTLVSRDI